MNDTVAVSIRNLGKHYMLYEKPRDRLKQSLLRHFGKRYGHAFWALRGASFDLRRGEILGVIGRNGSGKSTLLQMIAGTLAPSEGEIHVRGRVAALLELGSGFHPEYTGRENVFMNGAILGFSRREMEGRLAEIVSFAEIGEFIDQPVKTYSSGMFVRLAFAVQACVDPDVLIVDEALSVGDFFFQMKCHARMEELMNRKTAIILVSHDMSMIEYYSTRTLLLDKGSCLFLGQPNQAVEEYYRVERPFRRVPGPEECPAGDRPREKPASGLESLPDWPKPEAFLDLSRAVVIGEEDIARCTGIALCNERGQPCSTFQIGEEANFYFEFEILRDIQVPIGGVVITNRMNINVHGKNSLQINLPAPTGVRKGSRVRFRQRMEMSITPGEYTFAVGFATMSPEVYARIEEMDYRQLEPQLKTIMRVRQAGIFSVTFRTSGLSLPFYGYADLKGDFALAVL
jgi:ABC-type polysaccharide/polyol phosphate transport system ATPase subunit